MTRPAPILALALLAALAQPATAAHHLMQIEQVTGEVNGDPSAQAIQLRMRSNNQQFVSLGKLWVHDANGLNPILIYDPTTDVAVGTAGRRILFASSSFQLLCSVTPDFPMTNLIPPSYFAAGSITFENNSGTNIWWRLSWGGAAYAGPNTGAATNDADGDFGPPVPVGLPIGTPDAILFPGAFNALSTQNANDYVVSGPSTWTNNADQSCTLPSPPAGTVYKGMNHLPLGQAQLNPSGGHLIVSNIGSSGQDGVSIDLGESEFHLTRLDGVSPDSLPAGAELEFLPLDVGLISLGSLICRPFLPFQYEYVFDYRPLGNTTSTVELFLNGTAVFQQSGNSDPVSVRVQSTTEDTQFDPFWPMPPAVSGLIDLEAPVPVSIPGGPTIVADRVLVTTEGTLSPFGPLGELRIQAVATDFTIVDEALGIFHNPHRALGQATFDASGGHLTVSNIGSSGQDGVSIELDDLGEQVLVGDVFFEIGLPPAGAQLLWDIAGQVGGTADQPIASAFAQKQATDWLFGADFSPLGATTYTVQARSGQTVLTQATGRPAGGMATAALAPTDWHWVDDPAAPFFNHCTVTFPSPNNIVVFGAPVGVVADALRIIPENSTVEADFFQELVIRGLDIPSIQIDDENTGTITSVEAPGPVVSAPATLRLFAPAPNPFPAKAALRLALPRASRVTAGVYDVSGRLVRSILNGKPHSAGVHTLHWDGQTAGAAPASSGVYFFRVDAAGESRTVRGVLRR